MCTQVNYQKLSLSIQILQLVGGSKALSVVKTSANFSWNGKAVATSGGRSCIYIWAQEELSPCMNDPCIDDDNDYDL
jgi:hypothetical protein